MKTFEGDKPKKALRALKETISPQNPGTELAITEAPKNIDEINNKISNWCKKLILQIKSTFCYYN